MTGWLTNSRDISSATISRVQFSFFFFSSFGQIFQSAMPENAALSVSMLVLIALSARVSSSKLK
jgi:hypothetical protein